MAEVGLVHFARVCRSVAEATLPAYRSKFSKHVFTQPQLLTVLCLMRYEDWTFREAEVRLAEHRELRRAVGLKRVPDYTTLARFLCRLDAAMIQRVLAGVVRRLPVRGPKRQQNVVAVDGTGLTPGAISTYFVKRVKEHDYIWRGWVKWLVVVDVSRRLVVAQQARAGPVNDSAQLRSVVTAARAVMAIDAVVADAEFDSERNHQFIRQVLGAKSAIPAKRGKCTWRARGIRAQMRRRFPTQLYRQRALVETVFSVVKRKLSARAPGRSLFTQCLQALLLGLAFGIYRLRHVLCPVTV
jgi:hypothetical protein